MRGRFLLFAVLLSVSVTDLLSTTCKHAAPPLIHYYSRSNGVFETNIWSSVGHTGATCNCNPGCEVPSNSVIHIAHVITSNCANILLGSNTTLIIESGGSLVVNGNGSISGDGNVQVDPGGLLEITGDLNLSGSGTATINGTLNVYGDITGTGNAATGGICGTGQINVQGTAQPGVICGSVILPIELKHFVAQSTENAVTLSWTTLTEQNNKGFDVERSADGSSFKKIDELLSYAPQGNSNFSIAYEISDRDPISGLAYYRLKQIDHNGQFKYSPIISANWDRKDLFSVNVFPNPSNGIFTIECRGLEGKKDIQVRLCDVHGKIIYLNSFNYEFAGKNSVELIPSFPSLKGIYLMTVTYGDKVYQEKVIVH